MPAGSNKCAACGEFAGRGHKCAPRRTAAPAPAAAPRSATIVIGGTDPGVSDRVARAKELLASLSRDTSGEVAEDEGLAAAVAAYRAWEERKAAEQNRCPDCGRFLGEGASHTCPLSPEMQQKFRESVAAMDRELAKASPEVQAVLAEELIGLRNLLTDQLTRGMIADLDRTSPNGSGLANAGGFSGGGGTFGDAGSLGGVAGESSRPWYEVNTWNSDKEEYVMAAQDGINPSYPHAEIDFSRIYRQAGTEGIDATVRALRTVPLPAEVGYVFDDSAGRSDGMAVYSVFPGELRWAKSFDGYIAMRTDNEVRMMMGDAWDNDPPYNDETVEALKDWGLSDVPKDGSELPDWTYHYDDVPVLYRKGVYNDFYHYCMFRVVSLDAWENYRANAVGDREIGEFAGPVPEKWRLT